MLKVACSGPGVSRTRNLAVTSPILYHYTTARCRFLSDNVIGDSRLITEAAALYRLDNTPTLKPCLGRLLCLETDVAYSSVPTARLGQVD